jgi:MFS family permease
MNKKSFFIAAFGALCQYYDHHLFGFLAAVLSKNFTPSADPVVALLNTYFIMAIAVLAKPVGAIVLGRIGDVFGRAATLKISLFGTAFASLIISITPSYQQIGIIAAIILLFARMVVVAMVSSGTDGIRLFIYEHIGRGKQCLGNGLITTSQLLGSFVASTSAWFFTLDSMPYYSWRFAFMLGSVLGIIMLLFLKNSKFSDLAEYKSEPEYDEYKNTPILHILKKHLKLFVVCAVLAGAIGSTNHFCVIFFGTYVFKLLGYIPHSTMQFYTSIAIAIYIISAIISGWAADMFGRRMLATIGFIGTLTFAILLTIAISDKYLPISMYFGMMATMPMLTMPALAFLKQSIPKSIRYRIFSLAHAVGSICISSSTPFFSMLYFLLIINFIIISINIVCKYYKANEY